MNGNNINYTKKIWTDGGSYNTLTSFSVKEYPP